MRLGTNKQRPLLAVCTPWCSCQCGAKASHRERKPLIQLPAVLDGNQIAPAHLRKDTRARLSKLEGM